MSERNELARTMTDLPDELLLEAAQPVRRNKPIHLRRLAAAAAIIAMLSMTVYAVAGINWNIQRTAPEVHGYAQSYYQDDDGILDGEELNYQTPLTRVELSRDAMRRLQDILWRYWQLSQTSEYIETYGDSPQPPFRYDSSQVDDHMQTLLERYNPTQSVEPSYTALEQIEELLELTLDISPELREAARKTKYGICLCIETDCTMEEAAQMIEQHVFPEPVRLSIQFELTGHAGNGSVCCQISIPLTEETAQKGLSRRHYSYEKEGAIWQTTEALGAREVCFFGNDPALGYKGFCEAVYATGTGGYMLHASIESPDPGRSFPKPVYETAKDMLLPLLKNLN